MFGRTLASLARKSTPQARYSWRKSGVAATRSTNMNRPVNIARKQHAEEQGKAKTLAEEEAMSSLVAASRKRGPRADLATSKGALSHQSLLRGADVAHQMRSMSDLEWEAVPLEDKHAFAQFISKQLKEAPADVSDQQRRRYYEQTLADPSREDPHSTVRDVYQRIKIGLPATVQGDRQLGVTQAVYDQVTESDFDPVDAITIENAMTQVKQHFIDYVSKRRAGHSTEAERRTLASLSADLNHLTQRHLAAMFKHVDAQIQRAIKGERERQLQHIATVRKSMHADGGNRSPATDSSSRKERIRDTLRKVFGLNLDVVEEVQRQHQRQQEFLELCEVVARLTVGVGFSHSSGDESLDQYAASMKALYSADPSQLAGLDAVQYTAALEGVPPVDWAARWFENAVLLPLQLTDEFKHLESVRREEQAALATNPGALESADKAANRVVSLIKHMFVRPDDQRIASLQERRLRYLAHQQMQVQLLQMRENAKMYNGAEFTDSAKECRKLHDEFLRRKRAPRDLPPSTTALFADAAARNCFAEIIKIAKDFIATRKQQFAEESTAAKAELLRAALKLGPEATAAAVAEAAQAAKREQVERMLKLMERDVREDIMFVDALQEADRPPPLPMPEPMSYVSAADVLAWKQLREQQQKDAANPFKNGDRSRVMTASFLGQPWDIPDKPMLFWGTGAKAVEQALQVAAEEAAAREREAGLLPPPFPCAENPWGWRLRHDPLDEPSVGDSL